MADRVKYFLLGLLFLVVAGVIAYDRWNSADETAVAAAARPEDRVAIRIGPVAAAPPPAAV
ncbi:MAG: hypothetical protein ACREID_07230, partial [Planctomycetota bacterium]